MWHSCDGSAWDPISVAAWLRYRSGSHLPAWVELPWAAALLLLFWAVSHGPMHWIWSLNRKPPTCLPQGHFSDALAHLGWDIWIPEVPVQWWNGEDQLAEDGREEAAARSYVNHPLYQSHILCQDFFVLHACFICSFSSVWASSLLGAPLPSCSGHPLGPFGPQPPNPSKPQAWLQPSEAGACLTSAHLQQQWAQAPQMTHSTLQTLIIMHSRTMIIMKFPLCLQGVLFWDCFFQQQQYMW